jgi:hypothetical protein
MVAMVPELAREIERMRLESGLSIEELLASLHEQRERHHEERNATTATFPAGPSGGAGSASG